MARNNSLIVRAIDRATAVLRLTQRRIRALFAPLQRLQARFARRAPAAGLDRLSAGFGKVGNSLNKVGAEAGRVFGGIAKAAGVAGAAVTAFVVTQSEAGDALGKSAQRTGLSVDAFAQLSSIASDAGIDVEQFTSSIDTFNKALGEAKLGKGKLAAFLKGVSPSLLRGLKGAKNTEAALNVVFATLDRIDDAGKRAALSSKVFGNAEMTALVTEGLPALIAARKEYERLFGSQERFVAGASEFDDQLDGLKKTVGGIARGIATELFPAFSLLAKQLSKFLLDNKDAILEWAKVAGAKLLKFAQELPENIAKIAAKFDDMKKKLKPLADRVGGFANLLGIVAGLIVFGPLIGAIASLAVAFVSLGIAIAATPIGWILIGIAAIAAAAAFLVKDWEPIGEFFSELWGGVKKAFQGFIEFITGVFTLDMERAWKGLKKAFTGQFEIAKAALKLPLTIVKAFTGKDETQNTEAGASAGTIGRLANRPSIGAAAALPRTQAQPEPVTNTNNATVTVDFKNTPAGTKIRPGRDTAGALNLNVGYVPELGR